MFDTENYPHFKHRIVLARHGETEWSKSGKHTGKTDLPLTEAGERQAEQLAVRLKEFDFKKIYVSPLQRALKTCEIAGMLDQAIVTKYLYEWRYGIYEGRTTKEIREEEPNWTIFNAGKIKRGETIEQVYHRAIHIKMDLLQTPGDVILFSSGHFLRIFCTAWLSMIPHKARHFTLSTASLSILGYEHETCAVQLWNDTSHLK